MGRTEAPARRQDTSQALAMHETLQPRKSNRSLLRAVLVIILLGLGALAWEWHSAHSTPSRPGPAATKLTEP
jgi:hypothetical protein